MSQNPYDPSRPPAPQGPPPGGYGAPPPYYGAPPPQAYGPRPGDPSSPEMVALKQRIDMMQKLYLALFLGSLALLGASYTVGLPPIGHVAWAVTLGAAVITRIRRQSLINKYNAALAGGPVPLT